jgi:hypothetical protein
MQQAFPYLQYSNVHLAMDPEFRMAEPGQTRPGQPPGYVTADEVNQVQNAMHSYLAENGLSGPRVLIVHQFLESMIRNKAAIGQYEQVDVVITADGFGGPWVKISKYNRFMSSPVEFAGFKLFYRWDNPLLTPREVLGLDQHGSVPYMQVTPNLVIYQ